MSANYVGEGTRVRRRGRVGPVRRRDERRLRADRDVRRALRRPARLDHGARLRHDRPLVRAPQLALGDARARRDRPRRARASRAPRRQPRRQHRRHGRRRGGCLPPRERLDVDLIGGIGGIVRTDRAGAAAVLAAHGVRFGLENHPERTPDEVLARSATRSCSARPSTRAGGRRRATTPSRRSTSFPTASSTST